MPQLLFPNIAGATLNGFQQGQQMRANRLVGAAMQNPGDAQGYLAQAGAIDPRLALGAQGIMQQQQAQQQKAQQDQQTTTLKQIGGAARYYKAALQSGNPASVQAAKAQIGPLIMRLTGKQLPDSDTPETQAALDNVIAQTAYLFPDDLKLQTVTPGSTLTRGGTPVYSNPSQPKITPQGYQAVLGPDGTYHAEPIPIQGAPNGMGVGPAVPGAGASTAPQAAPNVGQAAPTSTVAGAPPGTQVSQATGPDGQTVQFAFSPDAPDAVRAQTGAMAGIPQGAPQTTQQPRTLSQVVTAGKAGSPPPAGYQWNASHTALQAIPGGPADTSANPDLTPEGSELVAVAGMQGYRLPISAIGTGKTGTKARIESVNDMAQKIAATGMDMETAVRNMRFGEAAQTASRDMAKRYGATWQNELAAAGQADIVLQESKNINQTDIQPINRFMVDWKSKTGSTAAQRFENALLTFANEYAKVMSGANGSGGATDSAREEAHQLLNKGFSNGQIEGTIALMKQEMRTRSQNQLDALQMQISNASNFGNAPQQPPQTQAAPSGWSIEEIH